MSMVFALRGEPEQRLDLSPLTPDRLAGLRAREVAAIELQTTRVKVTAGAAFKIRHGSPSAIRFEGGCERFDRLGLAMSGGEIVVDGDAGSQAGRMMAGGSLAILGSCGPWAGSGMTAGRILVRGNAGDWLGGPLPGELAGMRGGLVAVRGDAGEEAGHRLRRGTIVVGGRTGAHAGRSMIAGTLVIEGQAGPRPGHLMTRGTIVLGRPPLSLSPTFLDCGTHDLVFIRLLERALAGEGLKSVTFRRPLRRLAGDAATLGKGELLIAQI